VQITAEVQQLIEETAAAFREYQDTRAEVGRHLEAAQVSTDELARVLPPLPDLPDGPDEVLLLFQRAGTHALRSSTMSTACLQLLCSQCIGERLARSRVCPRSALA
jgi:hypothetical protein